MGDRVISRVYGGSAILPIKFFSFFLLICFGTVTVFSGLENLPEYPVMIFTVSFAVFSLVYFYCVLLKKAPFFLKNKYLLTLGTIFAYAALFVSLEGRITHIADIYAAAFIIVSGAAMFALYLFKAKMLTVYRAMVLILLTGAVIRALFAFAMPWYLCQHDIQGDYGHFGVIRYIAENQKLNSEYNWGQFYHPQVHYILYSVPYRIFTSLFDGMQDAQGFAMELLEFVSVFSSLITVIFAKKIFDLLKLSNMSKVIGSALFMFCPSGILMSRYLNNDSTLILFVVITVYFALKWYTDKSIKNAVFTGVFSGLAMCTKSSGILIVPIVLVLFTGAAIKERKNKSFNKYLSSACAFVLGFAPLPAVIFGRMYALFNQSPLFIMEPSNLPKAGGLFDRLFSGNIFADPFTIYPFDENVATDLKYPEYLLKSSLFGEFSYSGRAVTTGRALLLVTIILIILTLLFIVLKLLKKRDYAISLFIIAGVTIPLAFHIGACVSLPYACTYNYRYLAPFFIFSAVLCAKAVSFFAGRSSISKAFTVAAVSVFLGLSVVNIFWLVYSCMEMGFISAVI